MFSSDGSTVFSKLCEIKVSAEKQFIVQQHIGRQKHLKAVLRAKERKTSQLLLRQSTGESSKENRYL